MALKAIAFLVLIGLLYLLFATLRGLRSNIAKAQKTGLKYVIGFCNPHQPIWQQVQGPVLALCKAVLPSSRDSDWIIVMSKDWGFHHARDQVWKRLGDTFLIVTPQNIILYTRSPGVIQQITSRREDFPKATEQYGVLEMLGRNLVTTEGAVWKIHRKVTRPLFTEKSAAMAFEEAIRQTKSMLRIWRGDDDDPVADAKTVSSLPQNTMTLALNVIGTVGFGLRFLWPGETAPANTEPRKDKYIRLSPGDGHTMTFPNATAAMLQYLFVILIVPKILLQNLPFKWAKSAREASDNYVQYMHELVQDKREDLRRGIEDTQSMDIVGALVRAKDMQQQEMDEKGLPPPPPELQLTDDHIISNAFVMMLAGHETSANVLHFSMVLVAANPALQRALQADIDRLLPAEGDESSWQFEDCINGLLGSMAGAVMNETLRWIPPVLEIPKRASTARDQVLILDGGVRCSIPAGTPVTLSIVAAGRHEGAWPPNDAGKIDVHEWIPERWFRASAVQAGNHAEHHDEEDDNEGLDGAKTDFGDRPMFRPPRGALLAFSDGARSCLGRRLARVEIVAALAVIFRRYSIELAVDEWADDAAVERMDAHERAALYARATAKCMQTIASSRSLITFRMAGDSFVPVRVVRRGKERFIGTQAA